MKKLAYRSGALMLSAVAVLIMSGCDSKSKGLDYAATCPTGVDSYEGATGDNNMSTAGELAVGEPLQARNIYPHGDYDWAAVELEAGTVYELFTTNLN